ncbi:MAG: hypothetical protein ABSA48_01750 [Terracidiphilus sp.]|jgi:hypothetical protein
MPAKNQSDGKTAGSFVQRQFALPESTWDTHRDGPTFPDKVAEALDWLQRMPPSALTLQPGVIPVDQVGVERGAKKKNMNSFFGP